VAQLQFLLYRLAQTVSVTEVFLKNFYGPSNDFGNLSPTRDCCVVGLVLRILRVISSKRRVAMRSSISPPVGAFKKTLPESEVGYSDRLEGD